MPWPGDWCRSALILVGHGSTRCPGPGRQLRRHAETLTRLGLFAEVQTATLVGGPPPGEVLRALTSDRVYVMPMFMCQGQYVRDRVPTAFEFAGTTGRAKGRTVHVCPPIGLAPELADLIARRATERLAERGIAPGAAGALLIGHGSATGTASWRATEAQASRLRAATLFARVETAYLEQRPFLTDVVSGIRGPLAAVALLAAEGPHAREDIGRMIAESGDRSIDFIGAIGGDVAMPEIVLQSLRRVSRSIDGGGLNPAPGGGVSLPR